MTIRKSTRQRFTGMSDLSNGKANTKWIVSDNNDVGPDNRIGVCGFFDTEADAAAFIATLPEHESGRYNLDPPMTWKPWGGVAESAEPAEPAEPRRGWWNMACWNGLSPDQQRRLIDHGNLPIDYQPEGECPNGAQVAVETMWDIAPGPRFYCAKCADARLTVITRTTTRDAHNRR